MMNLEFIVVDNNALNSFIAERMLQNIDKTISVKTFLHGHEAFEYLEHSHQVSDDKRTIILLDIHMPLMDGFEFVEEFEKIPELKRQHFSIYILTSSTDLNDKKRSKKLTSIKQFISKPLTFNILNTIINQAREEAMTTH